MTSALHRLMAAHDLALAKYDASHNSYDPAQYDAEGHEIDRLRDAILAHRPALDEVVVKANFMSSRRTFTEWDDTDKLQLIKALTPTGGPIPSAQACPAGMILLTSIIGMAICAMWIAITWRAWG